MRKPNKLKLFIDFVSSIGMRYLTFRIVYAFQQIGEVFKRKFPNKVEVLENRLKQFEWSAIINIVAPWKILDAYSTVDLFVMIQCGSHKVQPLQGR